MAVHNALSSIPFANTFAPDLVDLALSQLRIHSSELSIGPNYQASRVRHSQPIRLNILSDPRAVMKQRRREVAQLSRLAETLRTHNDMMAPDEPITSEQKRKCLVYRSAGWNYTRICVHFNFTPRQAQYAILITEAVSLPQGATPTLTHPQVEIITAFVLSGKDTRRMECSSIATSLGWRCKSSIIRNALRQAGYDRYPALIRPTILAGMRMLRLAWAQDHIGWTTEQWKSVVWAGETRIMTGPRTRIYVTRKVHEVHDSDCIVDNDEHLQNGNTFVATFSGLKGKGPGIFWDPSWGTIDANNYSERVLPTMRWWVGQQPDNAKFCMQHGRTAHSDTAIRAELDDQNVEILQLPPASPDLDLMSAAWGMIKTKIEEDRLLAHLRSRTPEAEAMEAWNWIEEAQLMKLVESMPARCQAVIDADGLYTPYN